MKACSQQLRAQKLQYSSHVRSRQWPNVFWLSLTRQSLAGWVGVLNERALQFILFLYLSSLQLLPIVRFFRPNYFKSRLLLSKSDQPLTVVFSVYIICFFLDGVTPVREASQRQGWLFEENSRCESEAYLQGLGEYVQIHRRIYIELRSPGGENMLQLEDTFLQQLTSEDGIIDTVKFNVWY